MKNLTSSYCGLKLKNPIIVGSSGLTSTVEQIVQLAKAGAAAVVLKSVFEEEIIKEYETTLNKQVASDYNNLEFFDYYDYELKNNRLNHLAELISSAKKEVDIPIIASINCNTNGEWVNYAQTLVKAGADALELNIFKLPSAVNLEAEDIEKLYLSIIKNVKSQIDIPFSIKLAPYFTNMGAMIKKLGQSGASSLVLFNRFAPMDFDIEGEKVISGPVYSSVLDYENSLRWIALMAGKTHCELVASGGVHKSDTIIKYLLAGARSVEVVSSVYKEGAEIISSYLSEIEGWMERKGYESIDDFRGNMSQQHSDNPEMFERVQFMRYFTSH